MALSDISVAYRRNRRIGDQAGNQKTYAPLHKQARKFVVARAANTLGKSSRVWYSPFLQATATWNQNQSISELLACMHAACNT